MAKGTAIAKAKLDLPVDINKQLADEAAALAKRISAPSGDRILITQSKTFKMPDGQESPGPLNAIIVDFVSAYYFYKDPYQRAEVTPPHCFALGLEPAGLVPSANAREPQAPACASCWANQFKSDLQGGNGKACQNTRLLALLPPGEALTEETPLMLLKVAPTSTRAFDGYVSRIATSFQAPVRAVITEISFVQGVDYPQLQFGNAQPLDRDTFMMINARKDEALKRLLTEPDAPVVAANDAPKGRGRQPVAAARRAPPARKVANSRR